MAILPDVEEESIGIAIIFRRLSVPGRHDRCL